MKIKQLIEIFERLLPIYEKGLIQEDYSLRHGLCCAYFENFNDHILYDTVFTDTGYYKNYLNSSESLFPNGEIQPRIDFMKSEIKNLKKLLKEGYTHV